MHRPLRAKTSKLSASRKQRKKIGLGFRIPQEVSQKLLDMEWEFGMYNDSNGTCKVKSLIYSYTHSSVKLEDAEEDEEEENGDDVKDEDNT